MSKDELLHRLGVPAFRWRCPQCGRYCGELQKVIDMTQHRLKWVEACEPCKVEIDRRNEEHRKRKAENEVGYAAANIDYFCSQQRSSNYDYLAACEQMRREGW